MNNILIVIVIVDRFLLVFILLIIENLKPVFILNNATINQQRLLRNCEFLALNLGIQLFLRLTISKIILQLGSHRVIS